MVQINATHGRLLNDINVDLYVDGYSFYSGVTYLYICIEIMNVCVCERKRESEGEGEVEGKLD